MRLQVPVEKKPAQSTATLRHGSQREQPTHLSIGPVNDIYEEEASRVAEEVLRRPGLQPPSATSPGRPDSSESSSHSPEVESMVVSPGQPLDPDTRAFMETRFGYDFARVRVHADGEAAHSAHQNWARAYTLDQHIVFAQGEFSPATPAGRKLLAHELVHTIQQSDTAARQNHARGPSEGAGNRGLSPNPLRLQQANEGRVMRTGRGTLGSTNYRFDTFQIKDRDLSDPDIRERLNGLSVEGLLQYLDQVHDAAVEDYIFELLKEPVGRTAATELLQLQKARHDPAQRPQIIRFLLKQHTWGREYTAGAKKPPEEALAEAKKGAKDIRATTSLNIQGDIPAPSSISMGSLKKIFPGFAKDADTDPKKATKAKTYLENLNAAFKLMKIDTIQAQANYLAHSFIESDQFRTLTESQGVTKLDQRWLDDPSQVKLAADIGHEPNVPGPGTHLSDNYKPGSDINPGGKFEFVGRGPVQVTGRKNYRAVIAQLEQAAAFYLKQNDIASFSAAQRAAEAISADPKNAADPQYTFLASAALMKYYEGDRKVGGSGPVVGIQASDWVGGVKAFKKDSSQDKRLPDKTAAYKKAFCELLQDAKAENPNLQVPATADQACGQSQAGTSTTKPPTKYQ